MPKWIHDRADHIRRDNPGMPKSESFAIATQQAHASGHTPKDYGTASGKREAKRKYDEPKGSYEQQADPSHKSKSAQVDVAFWTGFTDELSKIASATPPLNMKPKAVSMPRESPLPTPVKDPLSSTKTMIPPPLMGA